MSRFTALLLALTLAAPLAQAGASSPSSPSSSPAPAAAAPAPAPVAKTPMRGERGPRVDAEKAVPADAAPSRAAVRAALAARRAHNLAGFRRYRKGGVYPHNLVRTGPLNVWRDGDGHLCAAATMIHLDGHDDLVQQVADTNPYLRLLDVTDGALLDWLLTSGFTLEEIDRIQLPMVEPSYEDRHPNWRREEDARLRRLYQQTDAYLVAHKKAGLDAATDRLMEHPALAATLVASST